MQDRARKESIRSSAVRRSHGDATVSRGHLKRVPAIVPIAPVPLTGECRVEAHDAPELVASKPPPKTVRPVRLAHHLHVKVRIVDRDMSLRDKPAHVGPHIGPGRSTPNHPVADSVDRRRIRRNLARWPDQRVKKHRAVQIHNTDLHDLRCRVEAGGLRIEEYHALCDQGAGQLDRRSPIIGLSHTIGGGQAALWPPSRNTVWPVM